MQRVLLASHGTDGARAAEEAAFGRLASGDSLYHLMVVPDFWDGMQGDDWLNNSSTRDVFADYVETTLEGEVKTEFARVKATAESRGVGYESRMVYGNPAECLLQAATDIKPDVVIAGSPRPKGTTGLRSRMLTDTLLRDLPAPLVIVPRPDDHA